MDPKRHYKKSDAKSKTLPKYFQASLSRHVELFVLLCLLPCGVYVAGSKTKENKSGCFDC